MNDKKLSVIQNSTGGLMATLLGIPKSIAFGMIVFAPLGSAFAPIGALAGLVSLALTNLIPSFFKGGEIVNSGPYSLSSLLLAAVTAQMSVRFAPDIALQVIFFTVFLSGVVQLIFGLLRFGILAKYIPYPVIAGLMNGSGLLILQSQIKPVFLAGFSDIINDPSKIFTASVMVTFVTAMFSILVYQIVRKFRWRFLAPLFSLAAGMAMFYILAWFTGISTDKLVIGKLPLAIPLPVAMKGIPELFFQNDIRAVIFEIIFPASIGIALVNSLSSFLAQNESDSLLRKRSDSNSGLSGQGIANIAAAFFGGITGAGSNSRTLAAFDYGARTRISQLAGGIFAVTAIFFSGPILSPLPHSVLAGVLILLAVNLFDGWVIIQLKEAAAEKGKRRKERVITVLVSLAVTLIMISFGIIEAVFAGVIFSLVIFVSSMSRGIISREYTGLKMRSNTERPGREVELLDNEGSRVRILELEGYLYFGTSDTLFHRIELILKEHPTIIILDLRRLKNIDATGIVALRQIAGNCRDSGCGLLLSSVDENSPIRRTGDIGIMMFDHFDDCLASAEDYLIEGYSTDVSTSRLKPDELDIFSSLTVEEINILMGFLHEKSFSKGDMIVAEGEKGDSVFFIMQGRADLFMKMPDGSMRRFYRMSRGAVFGEMSMIDGRPRSANVCAETDMVCLVLNIESLDNLRENHPAIAYKILSGVAALLSRRIRINISIIAQLR
jgi:MFS superfamily sulfate permease-like transporter